MMCESQIGSISTIVLVARIDICAELVSFNKSLRRVAEEVSNMSENKTKREMSARDVIELLQLFEQNTIEVFVDGGWGVDALLGTQTRPHADLDIALQHKYVPKVRELLEERGYKDIARDDTRDCNFVLRDDKGHEIDVHSYIFDDKGNNIFGVAYPFDSLAGIGTINGHPVRCISPEWMVKFHTGYAVDENDYQDVLALCNRFGIPLPSEYDKFAKVTKGIDERRN